MKPARATYRKGRHGFWEVRSGQPPLLTSIRTVAGIPFGSRADRDHEVATACLLRAAGFPVIVDQFGPRSARLHFIPQREREAATRFLQLAEQVGAERARELARAWRRHHPERTGRPPG